MTDQNNLVQWHSDLGEWTITLEGGESQSLEAWAREQEESSMVAFTLSAVNYIARWIELPGIKQRQLSRALPFALEELLIGDIDDYSFIPAGSHLGKFRAYVVATQLLDDLLELMSLHHLRLTSLAPESATFAQAPCIFRKEQGCLISISSVFEGFVPEQAMASTLDYIGQEEHGVELSIYAPSLDQSHLLQSTIATGYPDAFDDIHVFSGRPEATSVTVNLLQGRVVDYAKEDKPAPWWKSTAIFAACFAVLGMVYLMVANYQLHQQVTQVSDASLSLYKQWFPGERTSNFEVLFRRKLRGDASVAQGNNFPEIMAQVTDAWGTSTAKGSVTIESIRYSDRTSDFTLELSAKSQSDLQDFKRVLEKKGLSAAIASATEDKGVVKGRIRIGGSV